VRGLILFFGGLAACLSAPVAGAGVTETDARGHVISLAQPAQRIVSLAPHVTEIVYAAGAGDRLVGVSAWSDYPAEARGLPGVGDAFRVDLERVLSLSPDLVIGWLSGNSAADVARLESLGTPVYLSEPARLADIAELLRAVGRLAGTGPVAMRAASEFESGLAQLRSRYLDAKPVRVFVQIEAQPVMTLNGSHLVTDVLGLCGAVNVFAGQAALAPTVSVEAVVAAAPQLVLIADRLAGADAIARRWREMLPAARGAEPVRADLLLRHTPRVLEGAREVCAAVESARTPAN